MEDSKDKRPDSQEEQELFSRLEFSYSKSKEEVWASLDKVIEGGTEEKEETRREKEAKVVPMRRLWLAVAASVALIISAGLFARFYTKTIDVSAGEFASHTLPDGSEIHLNAATEISYRPYWWSFDRTVKLQGEAYFVVAKGEKFIVDATLGATEVLGTEFNVYARGEDFQVYCETGKVKVSSKMVTPGATSEVILIPGEAAKLELNELNRNVLAKQTQAVAPDQILSWRLGRFIYNNTPASKVFEDMERHYAIHLQFGQVDISGMRVTASFPRSTSKEGALDVICKINGLTFKRQQGNEYLIQEK